MRRFQRQHAKRPLQWDIFTLTASTLHPFFLLLAPAWDNSQWGQRQHHVHHHDDNRDDDDADGDDDDVDDDANCSAGSPFFWQRGYGSRGYRETCRGWCSTRLRPTLACCQLCARWNEQIPNGHMCVGRAVSVWLDVCVTGCVCVLRCLCVCVCALSKPPKYISLHVLLPLTNTFRLFLIWIRDFFLTKWSRHDPHATCRTPHATHLCRASCARRGLPKWPCKWSAGSCWSFRLIISSTRKALTA